MSANSTIRFSKKLLPAALGLAIALTSAGCMGPQLAPATSDAGWDTTYTDALSPHTQLALGVMNTLKDDPAQVRNQAEAAALWDKLAGQIEAKASDADINATRAKIEALMGTAMVDRIKAEQYRKTDLMGFMISSGMKIPKGGSGSLNPDFMAAQQAAKMLKDGGASLQAKKASEYKAVSPEEALSPVESLTLGTVVLLAEDRDSFEMSQVFRLALYFRPLRRMYDPNPDIIKASGSNFETVYMDRIWRVLRPEQIAAIREMNLTRKDMDKYLKEHVQLYNAEDEVPEARNADIFSAAVRREGRDVCLVTYGGSLPKAMAAAEALAAEGIEAEVIDLRVLRPLDEETVLASVRKCRRAVMVDETWRSGSLAAEIMARIAEKAFYDLDAPLARVCSEEVPIPYAKHLEEAALPQVDKILAAVRSVIPAKAGIQ